jgi:hypothetical protein
LIPLLRAGALALNLALPTGLALLLGLGWGWGVALAVALLALCWWACGLSPPGAEARAGTVDAALGAARLMGAPAPRFVREVPGWTAAAVRRGRGYGLLVGDALEPHHLEAVLGHEIAHHLSGDLLWEAFTDGPARLLLPIVRRVPPLVCVVFPFLLFGVPLAKATELRADRMAAARIPSYPVVLAEVANALGGAETILYPSLRARVRHSARHSNMG